MCQKVAKFKGAEYFRKALYVQKYYLRWTLDGLILFFAVKRGYSGEKKTSAKCIAPLENINGLFENVKKYFF